MNNDDLISRAALLKECAECQKTDPNFEGRGWTSHFISEAGEPSTEWYCVEDMIENAPAVDAVPVVHGRWLGWRHHWAWLVCDQCNEKMLVRKDNHGYIQEFPHNYCPNCGARMDGEADG